MGAVMNAARQVRSRYSGSEPRPLGGYLGAMATFAAAVGTMTVVGRARGVRLPERLAANDMVLLCVATHKASRLLAKDSVTSPLRAPFTEYSKPAGEAELNESVRGHGARHAVGELITCPFCLSVWVATALTAGLVFAPRMTRLANTVLTAVAASDLLQLGYDGSKQLLHAAGSLGNDD
ncbi:DUF1360 domain-containing protein [Saccharomonospora sp.]|uniref:DUF1360 domain-containing protein n=1 Tax=Saccharomonospora sp. TaxID=33913 RepID=UPI0026359848|nr:DUF1360 domain-containing protein [Saccharomonospora sp.]